MALNGRKRVHWHLFRPALFSESSTTIEYTFLFLYFLPEEFFLCCGQQQICEERAGKIKTSLVAANKL